MARRFAFNPVVAPTTPAAGGNVVTKTYIEATYAPLASPALSGIPTAPTPAQGDNDTSIATTAFVKTAVDAAVAGIDWHEKARLATAAALPACTYNNGAGTLTADANGALTVDGVAVAADDRILVKDQASGLQNGIYIVSQTGGAGAPFILARATDMDVAAEFEKMAFVPIRLGTANAGQIWYISATGADPVVVGTSTITFSQWSAGTAYTASLGVTLSGSDFRADLDASGGLELNGNSQRVKLDGTSLTRGANGVKVSDDGVLPAMVKGAYQTAAHGAASGGANTISINHATGYKYGHLSVFDAATDDPIDFNWKPIDDNNLELYGDQAYDANTLKILFMGQLAA